MAFFILALATLALAAPPVRRALAGCAPSTLIKPKPTQPTQPSQPPLPAPPPASLTRLSGSKVGFAATLDRSAIARGGDGLVRMELVMKADDAAGQPRVATDFVVVLDRSGSMSGDRIVKAKSAVLALIDQLGEHDRLGVVTFDQSAEQLITLAMADSGNKARWRELVQGIELGGGTNLSDGLDEGLALLRGGRSEGRAGRVLLLSDGEANAGDTSAEGLRARAQRAARSEQVLSTVGIGAGFNEYLMAQLADAGTGNFHYLTENAKLGSIIERELSTTRSTVAKGLRVQVALGQGVELVDAGGYPLERSAQAASFQPGSLFAGQERRLWLTLRVPADKEQSVALGQVSLQYSEDGQARVLEPSQALAVSCVKDEKVALAAIDKSAWERGVVQEEWGRVQQDVARAVSEGKRADALGYLSAYQHKQAALNASVGSSAVGITLNESHSLARQVDDAFNGADQASKQNLFSKGNLAKSRGSRRWGSF